jgi:hypothetical protein
MVVTRRSTSPSISDAQISHALDRADKDLPDSTSSTTSRDASSSKKLKETRQKREKLARVAEARKEEEDDDEHESDKKTDLTSTTSSEEEDDNSDDNKKDRDSRLDTVKERLKLFQDQYKALESEYERIENKFKVSFESLNKATRGELQKVWDHMDGIKEEIQEIKTELGNVEKAHKKTAAILTTVPSSVVGVAAQKRKDDKPPPPPPPPPQPIIHGDGLFAKIGKEIISTLYGTSHHNPNAPHVTPANDDTVSTPSKKTSADTSQGASKNTSKNTRKSTMEKTTIKAISKANPKTPKKEEEDASHQASARAKSSGRARSSGRSRSSSRAGSEESRSRSASRGRSSSSGRRSKKTPSAAIPSKTSKSTTPPKPPSKVRGRTSSPAATASKTKKDKVKDEVSPPERIRTRSKSGSSARSPTAALTKAENKLISSKQRTSPRDTPIKKTSENFTGLYEMTASDGDDSSTSSWSEKQPQKMLIVNDDEEKVCGWGSELSDSDLPQGIPEVSTVTLLAHDEDIRDGEGCGVHSILHELIGALGNFSEPTHDILDDIWYKLPQVDGVNYPTKTNIPDVFDRQAQLLKIMIVLYENVSTVAMKNKSSPDDIYSHGME